MSRADPVTWTWSAGLRHPVGGLVELVAVIALIAIAWRTGDGVLGVLDASRFSGGPSHGVIAAAMLAYVALMALPFCPGIEVGLALIVLGGPEIVPLVYLATVAALMLAYLAGRYVPPHAVIGVLRLLRLTRARELLLQLESLEAERRLHFLLSTGRPGLLRWLLEHRYVAVAIALNTPGNLVLGGGGGIALAAGLSRLFSLHLFALTVVLAASPVPIAVMLSAW